MDPTSNYTGMFLSDGHFQESVMFGKAKPKGKVDEESRLHDTAYAYWKGASNRKYRRAADKLYQERMPSGIYGKTAGALVHYGNHIINAVSGLAQPWNGYEGVYDELFGSDDWHYQQAVLNLYDTDPTSNHVHYTPNIASNVTKPKLIYEDTGGAQSGDYSPALATPIDGKGTGSILPPTSLSSQPEQNTTYRSPKLGDTTVYGINIVPNTKLPSFDGSLRTGIAFR